MVSISDRVDGGSRDITGNDLYQGERGFGVFMEHCM